MLRCVRQTLNRAVAVSCAGLTALGASADAADWIEVRSPHFTVLSDASKGDARRVAGQLEQIRAGFGHVIPGAQLDAGRPILAFAVLGRGALAELLPDYGADARQLPAGVFLSGGERHYIALVIEGRGERPYSTIRRAYTYLLLRQNFPWLPLWLRVGFSEFYGASEVENERIVIGARDESHRQFLQTHTPIPLEQFFSIDQASPYYRENDRRELFNAQAWAMVHYIMMADKGQHRGTLGTYLGHLSSGTDASQAATLAFGDLEAFGRTLEGYAHEERFFSQTVAVSQEHAPGTFAVRELAEPEFLGRRADLHVQRGQLDAARIDVEAALMRDPTSPIALEARGMLAWKEGREDEAIEDLSRVASRPDADSVTLCRHARLIVDGKPAGQELSRAKESLERAAALDSRFAPAHIELARLLETDDATLDQAAAHAARATEIEPGDSAHRIALARILFRLGRETEARREGEFAVRAAGSPEERESVKESLRFLDTRGGEGQLK